MKQETDSKDTQSDAYRKERSVNLTEEDEGGVNKLPSATNDYKAA